MNEALNFKSSQAQIVRSLKGTQELQKAITSCSHLTVILVYVYFGSYSFFNEKWHQLDAFFERALF